MGLTNAHTTFTQTMNNFFSNMLDSGIVVFLDNILVYLCKETLHVTPKKYKCAYISICFTESLRIAASYTTVQCSLALISQLKACILVTQRYGA